MGSEHELIGAVLGFDRLESAESTTRLIDYYRLNLSDEDNNSKIAGFIGSARQELKAAA